MNEKMLHKILSSAARPAALLGVAVLLLGYACRPAFAELDLSGDWVAYGHEDPMERGGGPYAVDYIGLPLNEAGRERALLYTASQIAEPERQCLYYTSEYLLGGPFGFKMWTENEPINGRTIAWHISATNDRGPITIWMDGRPEPSQYGLHPLGGWASGVWEGDVLKVKETHIKEGYLRRNGAPLSDQTTITFHFIRHGDMLTIISETVDPVYMTEPYVLSRNYMLGTQAIRTVDTPCEPGYEGQDPGHVPHWLPGKNTSIDEVSKMYNLPQEVVLGGAQTLYPDYRKKLKDTYVPPAKCPANCDYGAFATNASQ